MNKKSKPKSSKVMQLGSTKIIEKPVRYESSISSKSSDITYSDENLDPDMENETHDQIKYIRKPQTQPITQVGAILNTPSKLTEDDFNPMREITLNMNESRLAYFYTEGQKHEKPLNSNNQMDQLRLRRNRNERKSQVIRLTEPSTMPQNLHERNQSAQSPSKQIASSNPGDNFFKAQELNQEQNGQQVYSTFKPVLFAKNIKQQAQILRSVSVQRPFNEFYEDQMKFQQRVNTKNRERRSQLDTNLTIFRPLSQSNTTVNRNQVNDQGKDIYTRNKEKLQKQQQDEQTKLEQAKLERKRQSASICQASLVNRLLSPNSNQKLKLARKEAQQQKQQQIIGKKKEQQMNKNIKILKDKLHKEIIAIQKQNKISDLVEFEDVVLIMKKLHYLPDKVDLNAHPDISRLSASLKMVTPNKALIDIRDIYILLYGIRGINIPTQKEILIDGKSLILDNKTHFHIFITKLKPWSQLKMKNEKALKDKLTPVKRSQYLQKQSITPKVNSQSENKWRISANQQKPFTPKLDKRILMLRSPKAKLPAPRENTFNLPEELPKEPQILPNNKVETIQSKKSKAAFNKSEIQIDMNNPKIAPGGNQIEARIKKEEPKFKNDSPFIVDGELRLECDSSFKDEPGSISEREAKPISTEVDPEIRNESAKTQKSTIDSKYLAPTEQLCELPYIQEIDVSSEDIEMANQTDSKADLKQQDFRIGVSPLVECRPSGERDSRQKSSFGPSRARESADSDNEQATPFLTMEVKLTRNESVAVQLFADQDTAKVIQDLSRTHNLSANKQQKLTQVMNKSIQQHNELELQKQTSPTSIIISEPPPAKKKFNSLFQNAPMTLTQRQSNNFKTERKRITGDITGKSRMVLNMKVASDIPTVQENILEEAFGSFSLCDE